MNPTSCRRWHQRIREEEEDRGFAKTSVDEGRQPAPEDGSCGCQTVHDLGHSKRHTSNYLFGMILQMSPNRAHRSASLAHQVENTFHTSFLRIPRRVFGRRVVGWAFSHFLDPPPDFSLSSKFSSRLPGRSRSRQPRGLSLDLTSLSLTAPGPPLPLSSLACEFQIRPRGLRACPCNCQARRHQQRFRHH